jgi:hypothetical protein
MLMIVTSRSMPLNRMNVNVTVLDLQIISDYSNTSSNTGLMIILIDLLHPDARLIQ